MFGDVIHPELLLETFEPHVERLFCIYCIFPDKGGFGWTTKWAAEKHVGEVHGVTKDEFIFGVDVVAGASLARHLAEWREDCDRAADAFARELRSILDGEDLAYKIDQAKRP